MVINHREVQQIDPIIHLDENRMQLTVSKLPRYSLHNRMLRITKKENNFSIVATLGIRRWNDTKQCVNPFNGEEDDECVWREP